MNRFLRPVALLALPVLLAACGHGATSALPQMHAPGMGAQAVADGGGNVSVRENCGPVLAGFARCMSMTRTDIGFQPDMTFTAYVPAQLQAAYNLPSKTAGMGQTVAIVDAFDDPTAESDLAKYRKTFNESVCSTANGCFKKLNQLGQPGPYPPVNAGWDIEISLDVDMVSAICPNCHIMLMESDDNSFANLAATVDEAAKLKATEISNSYGGGEYSGEQTDQNHYKHRGIMVTVSSGDGAFSAGPQFPAASQFVTAVGGTSLHVSTNKRKWTEVVWPGAGSGCSAFITKPTWQKDTGCARRTIADVSAQADPSPGVVIVYHNTFTAEGGTSVASPIIASVYALAGNGATLTYGSQSYRVAKANLYDIIMGNNGSCSPAYLCTAEKGYDGPTGNGTPHGVGAF
jgi:subtilase family serine protease